MSRPRRWDHRAALAILEKAAGANAALVADTRMNIGVALLATGEVAPAIAEYERARTMRGNVFGLEHPIMASTHAHIADAHMAAGAHRKAVRYRGLPNLPRVIKTFP